MSDRRLQLMDFLSLCGVQGLEPSRFNYFLYRWTKGIILKDLFMSVRRFINI